MAYSKSRVSFYTRTERFANQSRFMTDLTAALGSSQPLKTVSHSLAISQVPISYLPSSPLIDRRPETRLRFASGDTMLDWVSIASRGFGRVPDGVSFPQNDEELSVLLSLSEQYGFRLKPYFKDNSFSIMQEDSDQPTLVVSLARFNRLSHINPDKKTAVFQAGALGTDVDAALMQQGFCFDHMYGSFEDTCLQQRALISLNTQELIEAKHLYTTSSGVGGAETACVSKIWPGQDNGFIGLKVRGGITTHSIIRVKSLPEKPLTLGFLFYHWQHALAVYRNLLKQRLPLMSANVMNALATRLQVDMTDQELNQELLINELDSALPNKPCLLWVTVDTSKISSKFYMIKMLDLIKACDVRYHSAFTRQKFYFGRPKQLYLRQKLWRLGYSVDSVETTLPTEQLSVTLHQVYTLIRQQLGDRVELMFHSKRVSDSLSQILITYIMPVLNSADDTYWQLKHLRIALDKIGLS